MTVRTLGDVSFDGGGVAECFHCDELLPLTATAELDGDAVVVTCPKCGCFTPFKVLPSADSEVSK